MKKNRKHFVLLLFVGLILSCKSVRVLPNKAPVKRVDIAVLSDEIVKAEENIKNFRARIKAEYNDQKRKQQLSVNFRLQKESYHQ